MRNPSSLCEMLNRIEIVIESQINSPTRNQPPVLSSPRTALPSLEPILVDDFSSDTAVSTEGYGDLDTPAVHLRRRRRSKKLVSDSTLTEPHATTTDEPTPIKRRLFESLRILTIDIGATRTKFMFQFGSKSIILPHIESKEIWGLSTDHSTQIQMGKLFRSRLSKYLTSLPVTLDQLDAVIFSVPGTVDLSSLFSISSSSFSCLILLFILFFILLLLLKLLKLLFIASPP